MAGVTLGANDPARDDAGESDDGRGGPTRRTTRHRELPNVIPTDRSIGLYDVP